MKNRIRSAFGEIQADKGLIDNTAAYLKRESAKRQPKNKSYFMPKLVGTFMAMAVVIAGIFSYNLYSTADAYVSIDVNPSLELTLNRFDRVIATYAFNGDGESILSKADLSGKSYEDAAGLIISFMEAKGYFLNNALVSVTVQAASSERERLLCSALQRLIDEQVQTVGAASQVEVFPVSAEVWGKARGCNLSPAKYLAIQELMEVDEEATLEAYTDSSIRQIRRRTQECRGMHGFESESSNEAESNSSEANPSNEHKHGHGNSHGSQGNQKQE